MAVNVDGGELRVGYLDALWVGAGVEPGVNLQPRIGRGGVDQVDDDLVAFERLAAPVGPDEAEQSVLDPVPLARTGREVADGDRDPEEV